MRGEASGCEEGAGVSEASGDFVVAGGLVGIGSGRAGAKDFAVVRV